MRPGSPVLDDARNLPKFSFSVCSEEVTLTERVHNRQVVGRDYLSVRKESDLASVVQTQDKQARPYQYHSDALSHWSADAEAHLMSRLCATVQLVSRGRKAVKLSPALPCQTFPIYSYLYQRQHNTRTEMTKMTTQYSQSPSFWSLSRDFAALLVGFESTVILISPNLSSSITWRDILAPIFRVVVLDFSSPYGCVWHRPVSSPVLSSNFWNSVDSGGESFLLNTQTARLLTLRGGCFEHLSPSILDRW